MSRSEPSNQHAPHLHRLQEHALSPVQAAIRTTQNEQAELESEKDALADFVERLNEIPAVQPDAATPPHALM